MRIRMVVVVVLACVSFSHAQINRTANLTTYVDSLISAMPSSVGSNAYQPPNATELTQWGTVISEIMQGQYATAHSDASAFSYELVAFTDNGTSQLYYILQKKRGTTKYWGTFVLYPNASRPALFIQSPHPLFDSNTGAQGLYIFKTVRARAFMMSGANRCNSTTLSACDGTTTACTGDVDASYPISDQAHVVNSTFQKTTEILNAAITSLIVVQMHGFGQETGDPDVIMGNGTTNTPPLDYLVLLRNNLTKLDALLTFKVGHVDVGWTRLTGTNNTQGRLINGSADPCGTSASSSNGRFLHLEQTGSLRQSANWWKMANAFAMTFPVPSVQSGDWDTPSTWAGGIVPDTLNSASIAAAQTVTISSATATAFSVSFGDVNAKISFGSVTSVLNVYGDFTLASTVQQAFSAWPAGAKIKFTGSSPTQTLSGWSGSGFSTSFDEMVVDKPAGKVMTGGTDMRLGIGNTLDVVGGAFELASTDDIESRTFSGTASSANIFVRAGATFNMVGSSSHIRRAANTSVSGKRIGKLTLYGTANVRSTSSNGINFATVDIESGGLLNCASFSSGSPGNFNPQIVTVKSGGELRVTSSVDFWEPTTSSVVLQNNGVFRVNVEPTVAFPPSFTNAGTVRYGAIVDQTVKDMDYYRLEISFSGNKTWTVASNRIITDSLEVNNSSNLVLTATAARTVTVNGTLRLTTGTIDNSDPDAGLTLANGATISRATGTVTNTPTFAGNVNLRYTSSTASVTTGPELPVSPTVINNFTVTSTQGVTLGGNATVNGALTLSGSNLFLGTNTLTLGQSATVGGTPSATSMVVTDGAGELRKVFSAPASFTFPLGDNTGTAEYSPATLDITSGTFVNAYAGMRVTNIKHPNNASPANFLNRYWSVTQNGISGFTCNAIFNYVDADVNGAEAFMYTGQWNGSGWTSLNAANVPLNQLSGTVASFSDFTGGEASALPIQLVSFEGRAQGNGSVNLAWRTLSEVNNYGFYVQRKAGGAGSFEEPANNFVPGHGTTNTPHQYSFVDNGPGVGPHYYRLKHVDLDGTVHFTEGIRVDALTSVNEPAPVKFQLLQNYPNPFNPTTEIRFSVAAAGRTRLDIYNLLGDKIATLFDESAEAGRYYRVTMYGKGLASGVYFCKLQNGEKIQFKKMLMVQ